MPLWRRRSVGSAWSPISPLGRVSLPAAAAGMARCARDQRLDAWQSLGRLGLAAVAAIAERGRVRLTRYLEESISLLPTLFAAVVFGPLAAMVVAAASMLGAFGSPYLKWATYTCGAFADRGSDRTRCVAAAGLSNTHIASVVIATTVGALVSQVSDAALRSRSHSRSEIRGSRRNFSRHSTRLVFLAVPFYAPLVAVLAFAYRDVSPWTLPLFFGPALAAQRLFGLYQQERQLARRPGRGEHPTRARQHLRSRQRWSRPSTHEIATRRVIRRPSRSTLGTLPATRAAR